MNETLQQVLKDSTFQVIPGTWLYLKVRSAPPGDHFMVTNDGDEVTVITEKGKENELDIIERNKDDRALICLNVSVPFYSVGFLAAISSAIANADLNILIVSTYSKDYILVKSDSLEKAKKSLSELGLKEI